jgi:ribosomal protein L14
MVGKMVMCRVKSAQETKSVYGTIVKRCNNENVFVLKISQPVDFFNGKMYTYPKNATMLVTQSEIVK